MNELKKIRPSVRPSVAAEMLESSPATIVNYCKRGLLEGSKNPVTGSWSVDVKSVQRLLAKRSRGIDASNCG